jgi:hypothetical protein
MLARIHCGGFTTHGRNVGDGRVYPVSKRLSCSARELSKARFLALSYMAVGGTVIMRWLVRNEILLPVG